MHLVSISMYLTSLPLAEATAKLWSFLRHYLSQAGLTGLPEALDQTVPYDEVWLRPLAYITIPAAMGADAQFIIVRRGSSLRVMDNLRGTTAAINSGSILIRVAVASLARNDRFFGRII